MKKSLIEPNWRRQLKAIQKLPDDNEIKIMLAKIEQLIKGFYSAKNPPNFESREKYNNYISRLVMALYVQAIKKK